jgi:hypothetical protein
MLTPSDDARGWYLYGITRSGSLADVLAEADAGPVGAITAVPANVAPLELLECSGLAAVVRPILLADFSQALMQERLRNASDLETIAQGHNRVIDAIHARQAILPAKFGMVYAHAGEIVSAVRSACEALLPQLHRLEGCDEWALHIYADRSVVRERASGNDPVIQRLREEAATARPGRAYFIERQLRDRLETATRDALVALAQRAYDQLAASAVAGQVSPLAADDAGSEVEILRAALLVARNDTERFESAVQAITDTGDGLRCLASGPWPPYSFAARDGEGVA